MDFTNKTINFLNLHSGIQRFSINIFDTFWAVYLLGIGISFPVVALVVTSNCILRTLLRPLSLFFSEKIGLKRALIFGVFIGSGIFLVLSKVSGVNNWLYFYIFYLALCDITYWLPYHSYYAVAGDLGKRGRQIGSKLGLVTIFRMAAPLVGGIIITHFGFLSLYVVAMLVMQLSIIPLLFTEDIKAGKLMNFNEALKTIGKRGMIIQFGEGISFVHNFIWTIVLFYSVGNYITFGGLVTFEMFCTTFLVIFLGSLIDKGKGKRIFIIGLILIAATILLRSFLVTSVTNIMVTDILLAFGMTFYVISLEFGFYNLSKKSENTLWFNFFGELGWDTGAAISLLLCAGLFILGVPIRLMIILSLFGLSIVYCVLKNYY